MTAPEGPWDERPAAQAEPDGQQALVNEVRWTLSSWIERRCDREVNRREGEFAHADLDRWQDEAVAVFKRERPAMWALLLEHDNAAARFPRSAP